jgi:RimJ/RimL family protein N-acetyltransferase
MVSPARGRPGDEVLTGVRVRLEPLAAAHADALFAAQAGDDALWDYMAVGPFTDAEAWRRWVDASAAGEDPRYYAVVAEQGPAGVVSYLRIEPADGCIEIGHIWYGPALQRTAAATEAIYLLARHAFDSLGNRRLEWKCDSRNARSRAAAERFGFTFEGIFRQHMIVKGRNRDTAWYSMLDREWHTRRAAFETWLAPENFDAQGHQRRSLRTLISQ